MSKRVTFERIKNPNIIAYAIFIKDNGKLKKIGEIENPNKENPVNVIFSPTAEDVISSTKLAIAYRTKHTLVTSSINNGVVVTINSEKADDSIVAFNKEKRTIVVYAEVKQEDIVTISYYIDGVEYVYDSDEDHEFVVKALFNEFDMTVGKHYQLI